MNREPPKNVYSNNRLKKIGPSAWPIDNQHQSCHQFTSIATSRGMTETNISVDMKERSLHFNKSQSKYEKHFMPTSAKALASQMQNENSDVKKLLPNFKHPSTLGDLGIPLKHCYVQRKSTTSNCQSLQPVCKKSRKSLDSLELQENLFHVSHAHNADNPLWMPFQEESPNQLLEKSNHNDPHDESEFFQMVKTTLEDTFEEVAKDCPEFLSTTLNAKVNLLKKLRSYTQRQQVVGDHSNIEDMSTSGSDNLLQSTRPEGFSRFPGESSTESHATKPKLHLIDDTSTTMATTNSWAPAAYCFETYSTPREFLPRSRRYTGSVTNVSERMPSDRIQISSKGSSIQVNGSLSLSQTFCNNNSEETDELTPTLNPSQVPSFSLYPNVYGNWLGFL